MSEANETIPLDIIGAHMAMLPGALSEIFHSRRFRRSGKNSQTIKFNSFNSLREDEGILNSINDQRAALPHIIIRETGTELSTDGGNQYISSRDGYVIGRIRDGREVVTLHVTPVTVTAEIKIRSDDQTILNHFRDSLISLSYGEYFAGIAKNDNPYIEFQLNLQLPKMVNFSPYNSNATEGSINELNFTLTFRSSIASLSLIPTVGEVMVDTYVTNNSKFPVAINAVGLNDTSNDIAQEWQPDINFVVNNYNTRSR